MIENPPVAIDLFSGAGGLSLGFERAGFDVRLAIDSDEHAVRTYSRNFDAKVFCADLTLLDALSLDIDADDVDAIVGGPPCPTFSSVGRSKINSIEARDPETDGRHELYEHFLRFVRELEPTVVLMENVPGMRSAVNDEGYSVLEVIRREMNRLEYTTSVQFPDAADFGVPQHRVRTIFIGNRLDQDNPDVSRWESHRSPRNDDERDIQFIGDTARSDVQQGTLGEFGISEGNEAELNQSFPNFVRDATDKDPWVTVGEALLDLPPLSPNGEMPPSAMSDYVLPPFTKYQEWAREEVSMDSLENHEARGQNLDDLSLYKLLGEGVGWIIDDIDDKFQPYRDDIFPDNYRKQQVNRPASTILAHISKDGHQYIHPREARSFSVREAARLQSFPDDFVFPVSRTQAYRQVGNAVPPLLAQAIGTSMKRKML